MAATEIQALPEYYVRTQGGYTYDSRRPLRRIPYFTVREDGVGRRIFTAAAIVGTSGSGFGLSPLRIKYVSWDGSAAVYEAFSPECVSMKVVLAQEPAFRKGDRVTDHTGAGEILDAHLGDDGLWSYLVQEHGMFRYSGDTHWAKEWQIVTPLPVRD